MSAGFVGYDKAGHFVHYCHCGDWAAYGVSVHLISGRLGHWRCHEHRAELQRIKAMDHDFASFRGAVPARYLAKCHFCDGELDIRAEGSHQWRAGFVMVRGKGGGHGLSCPVLTNTWAHHACVDRASRGQTKQQTLDLPIPPPA